MSSLWTPSGEHVPDDESRRDQGASDAQRAAAPGAPPGAASDAAEASDAEVEEELRRVRAELAGTPVANLIANHAIGLWQLAVLHLTPEEGQPLRLDEAGLAIDAMASLVEGLGERLGESSEALREALAQLRVAYVQITERVNDASADDASGGD